jgi:hypothetical protein
LGTRVAQADEEFVDHSCRLPGFRD